MVCSGCVGSALGKYIIKHGYCGYCSCCNQNQPKVMTIDNIEQHILQSWSKYYESAEDFGTDAYETFGVYEIGDLLDCYRDDLELEDANPEFIERLRLDLEEYQWFDLNEGSIHGEKAMLYNWETFCRIVKHEKRYFLLYSKEHKYSSANPRDTLESIAKLIQSQRIVTEISPDEPIYRGRAFSNCVKISELSATDLGTPKPEYSKTPNRFSPEGIPLFYGSFDLETVKYEVCNNQDNLVIGEFHTLKEIAVIDFAKLPPIPSIYDEEDCDYSGIAFLSDFEEAISEPVEKSGLDYIPTQVFTEYIREVFGETIKGIKYSSSKNLGKNNMVLFYKNKDCFDSEKMACGKDGLVLTNIHLFQKNPEYREITKL